MAEALHSALGVECELIAGGRGVFQVMMDGRTVFERKLGVKIPDPEVLARMIADQAGGENTSTD